MPIHMRLSDIITSDGLALDGDWTNPESFDDNSGNSTFDGGLWSGDGTTGGDFVFNFTLPNTRPGDADRNGIVNYDDLAIVSANWLETEATWEDGDFNGDEIVNDYDATLLSANMWSTVWQSGSPTASAPLAYDVCFKTEEEETLYGLLFGHAQGRSSEVTYALVANPSHGTVTVNADGTFSYTPYNGYSGEDTFTFKVNDGVADSATAATATIYVGVSPPVVVSVVVAYFDGTSTVATATIATAADGNDQLLLVVAYDAAETAYYDGINQIIITFDQPVTAAYDDLTLNGYTATSFEPEGNTCIWTFGEIYKFGPMVIELDADGVTANGLALDGEWSSPESFGDDDANSTFDGGWTSGNGFEGGDFFFNFSMLLPGDADCNGIVDEEDAGRVASNWLDSGEDIGWAEGDFNGDGTVNDSDAVLLAANWYRMVWKTVAFDDEFDAAAGGSVSDSLSGMDRLEGDDLTYSRVANAAHGSVTVSADGSFTYTPTSGYFGLDEFTFRTYDGVDYSAAAESVAAVRLDGEESDAVAEVSLAAALDTLFAEYGLNSRRAASFTAIESEDWDGLLDEFAALVDRYDLQTPDYFADDFVSPHQVSSEPLASVLA